MENQCCDLSTSPSTRFAPSVSGRDDNVQELEDIEVDVDVEIDFDRLAIFGCGLELVLPDGFDGLLVKTHPNATHDPDMRRIAMLVDPELDLHVAGELALAGFLRELGFDGVDQRGPLHQPADVHGPSASIATGTGSDTVA